MSTVLYIIAGAWLLCLGGIVCLLWRATSIETPKPTLTGGQIEWFVAQAKVAHRRAS